MTLEQKVTEEMKLAMKSGNKMRLETLRSLRAGIIEFAKSGLDREMNQDDEIKLLNNQAKRRRDAIEMYNKAGRTELKEKEEFELSVIQEFLPKQLSDEELSVIIKSVIEKTGASSMKDMGKVMAILKPKLQGRADIAQVSSHVKMLLAKE